MGAYALTHVSKEWRNVVHICIQSLQRFLFLTCLTTDQLGEGTVRMEKWKKNERVPLYAWNGIHIGFDWVKMTINSDSDVGWNVHIGIHNQEQCKKK